MMKVLLIAAAALTLAGCMSSGHVVYGGGGGGSYQDEWADSPLVENDGSVTMHPGEVKTEHPSTDPNDSGFDGNGPPSIDG